MSVRLTWTKHDGTSGQAWWPSLGLIRAWGLMVFLDLATPYPLTSPGFLICWALVTIMRLLYRLIRGPEEA